MHTEYNDPYIGWPLLAIALIFNWLAHLSQAQLSYYIAIASGSAATISFIVRIVRDWHNYREERHKRRAEKMKKRNHETVVDKPGQG